MSDLDLRPYSTLYVVFADNQFDLTCASLGEAAGHMFDLMDSGFSVKAFVIDGESNAVWEAAYELEELAAARPFGRKGMTKLASKHSVGVRLEGARTIINRAIDCVR